MSRVLVVTSSPLFVEGGHLVIARSLVRALEDAGHEAQLLVTPQNRFGHQGAAYLATWLTDVTGGADGRPVDHVISFRFPSYAVRHPSHVCWLNHRMREYYDLWPSFSGGLARTSLLKERVRRFVIRRVDGYLLTRNVRKVFAQSRTVQERLARIGGIPSDVLYPPAPQRPYRCDEYGDYVLAVSRLTPLKRIDLIVRAIARPDAGRARLVVAGDGGERAALQALADELGVAGRVEFVGEVDSEGLVGLLASCRAVCFPPRAEDYGFVTVEAFAAAKPVITCADSGGPTELVHDGVEGLICDPAPGALASSIGRLMDDRGLAERMGASGLEASRRLSWDSTIRTLLLR